MKLLAYLDRVIGPVLSRVAVRLDKNPHSRWHTQSVLYWFLLRRHVLRSDYNEYTARRYAANIREAENRGVEFIDFCRDVNGRVTDRRTVQRIAHGPRCERTEAYWQKVLSEKL